MRPLVLERSRGILHATGRDPVKMVHDMVTSAVQGLPPDQAAYGLFLTAKGRVVADVRVIRDAGVGPAESGPPESGPAEPGPAEPGGSTDGSALWIDTDPAALEGLLAHLGKYVPPLFATFEDVSDDWAVVGVYGDGATDIAGSAVAGLDGGKAATGTREGDVRGLTAEAPEERIVRFEGGFALKTLLTGHDGWDLFVPAAERDRAVQLLLDAGGRPGDPEAVDALRIAAGRPRFGRELTGDVIPLEAGLLDRAIDQEKGCYTGQEVIVRILHRGHVNRHLRRLEFAGPAPDPGTELFESGLEKPRGTVTSVAENEAGAIGLGYVRREVEPPAELRVGSPDGEPVVVSALDD
ncbi:MAG: CAF17-like 4Fe-4S cluster assembly/insertion protein YgfZ [Candidatus Longimicrobiales bacterium M2_2A_002]